MTLRPAVLLMAALMPAVANAQPPSTPARIPVKELQATPSTVAYGYYDAAAPPVMRIASGDGHAAQGDGEVDITALETSLVGTFQFVVRKDLHLSWPRAETPTEWITMGMDDDLTEAAKIATREMIDFLATTKKMTREDAYMLTSVAGDLVITQVVDGPKGVHVRMAKKVFTR